MRPPHITASGPPETKPNLQGPFGASAAARVGQVEHVYRVRLPLDSSDRSAIRTTADEAAPKTFARERPKFTCFPRLSPEI